MMTEFFFNMLQFVCTSQIQMGKNNYIHITFTVHFSNTLHYIYLYIMVVFNVLALIYHKKKKSLYYSIFSHFALR